MSDDGQLAANSWNSNSLRYVSYKSESCRSTSIGCVEFSSRMNRERCRARCLLHLQAWHVRILRSPPSCRHCKLPRATQRQNNILKSMYFLEIDLRFCNGSKMMENGCAWWIHLWWVKNISPLQQVRHPFQPNLSMIALQERLLMLDFMLIIFKSMKTTTR